MGYAVELLLQMPKARVIQELFGKTGSVLADIGTVPHVSLAVFDDVNVGSLTAITESFAHSTPVFTLRFSSIGIFPGPENVVFLAPVVTQDLLSLHKRLHQELATQILSCDPYYLPGAWVPHCAITVEEPILTTLETVRSICESTVTGEYEVDQIAAVKYRPVVDVARFALKKRPGIHE